MKKELFYQKDESYFIKGEYKNYFKNNKIYIKKNEYSSFLLFMNQKSYDDFIEEFYLPKEITCCIFKLAQGEHFTYFREILSKDTLFGEYGSKMETKKRRSGGIISEHSLFIGNGIYCVKEEDFQNDYNSVYYLKDLLNRTKKLGDGINISTLVFKYTGPYYECINGINKIGIINILQKKIEDDDIVIAMEEKIEVKIKERV